MLKEKQEEAYPNPMLYPIGGEFDLLGIMGDPDWSVKHQIHC